MSLRFMPEYRFNTFAEVTADFLLSIGVRGIVLDVDNTLEPYENPKPTEKVVNWLNSLKNAGISASVVSNNDKGRIDLFNEELGLITFSKAGKPFKKRVVMAMKAMGTDKSNTILMGDQIFTDVWAAHNAGIPAILVPPIRDKQNFLTRFKRWLEKPILRRYERRRNKDK